MAKKKVVVEGVEEVVVSTEDYTNEFRVYGSDSEFVAFYTVEEAQAEVEANGGTIAVASVK